MYSRCVCKPVTHFSTACLYAGYKCIHVVFVSRSHIFRLRVCMPVTNVLTLCLLAGRTFFDCVFMPVTNVLTLCL